MKVHSQCICIKINGCPKEVPDLFLNEEWASKIHGQTLKRLNERGGMSVHEILCNARKTDFETISHLPCEKAITILLHMLAGFEIGINAKNP